VPGNAGGIRAGKAFVEAGLEDAGLRAGLKAAEAKLKAFGAGVAGIGAKVGALGLGITGPLLNAAKAMQPWIKGFADAGSELNDMSSRTGVSVEALSAFGHAATQTGASLGDVETGVKKMQKALVAARQGGVEAQVAFGSLGLSVEQLSRLKPEDQFQAIAKRIGQIKDPTAKAAVAMQIFGKSGTSLIPMIDDIDALTKEAKDLGLIMSSDDAKAADELGDAMDNVTSMFARSVQLIGAALAPLLLDLAGNMMRLIKTAMDWVKENQTLIVTVFKVGAGLVAAGAAFVALGAAISGAGTVLGGIAAAIGVVGTVIGALLSPIGLVVVGLAGALVAFFKFTDAGGQALSWLGERFGDLVKDATGAFDGIANALKAGDIKLAGEILWAFLKLEFLKGLQFLRGIWADWGNAVVDVVKGVQTQIASIMIDLSATIQGIWASIVSDLTGSWGSMIARMIKMLVPFADTLAQLFGVDIEKSIDDTLNAIGVKQASPEARKTALAGQLGGIESQRQGAQQALKDQQQAEMEARRKASQEALATGAGDIQKAEDELSHLMASAWTEAAFAGVEEGTKQTKKKPQQELPGDLLDGLDSGLKKIETKGTFSAAGLRGLGIGDTASEQLKEQQKATKQLEKLNEKLRKVGPLVANEP
jgi:hypothetical protein